MDMEIQKSAVATGNGALIFSGAPRSASLRGEIAMWVHAEAGVLTQFLMYEILRLAGADEGFVSG